MGRQRLVKLAKAAQDELNEEPNATSEYIAKIQQTREALRRLSNAVIDELDDGFSDEKDDDATSM